MSPLRLSCVAFLLYLLVAAGCSGGTTIIGGNCSAQSCPSGCCTAAGKCDPGITATACGSGGAKCQACVGTQSCTFGQCSSGNGGSGGSGGTGGTGGSGGTGGTGGTGGFGGFGGFAGSGGAGGGVVDYDGGCGPIDAGNPPYPARCVAQTINECDGTTDGVLTGGGVPAALLNGQQGNGFDDDCDGLVDEGCSCPGNGLTKDCYLVPATQANPATKQPVGWCTTNAKGSLDCAGGELASWSGVCRGAQRPGEEVCGPGDFNCDGLEGNSRLTGCSCPNSVACPTTAITLAPYPNPSALPLIDGSLWISNASQRASTTNWTWTALGGDCDNVLPFPTFALFNSASATTRVGTRTTVKYDAASNRYIPQGGEPLAAIRAPSYGSGVAGGQIHPAFALSGDYLVQGEFDLAGQHYTCTQKVQVRAPGIRAELCWDSVGSNDIDLHFGRLQGQACNNWDSACNADCYWSNTNPGWGYSASAEPGNLGVCHGWGSKNTAASCNNPRLDRDNISCDRNVSDPNDNGGGLGGGFCGPENINLDHPNDNDTFVVGVNQYGGSTAKPHVNLYCNGQRVVSVGYNPATGQTGFPLLNHSGGDSSGDFWTVGTIKAHVTGGNLTSCDVATIPSRHADPTRDGPAGVPGGGNNICVDSTLNQTPAPNQHSYSNHQWIEAGSSQGGAAGSQPTTAAQWCKH